MNARTQYDVLIRGDGIVGCTLALLLAQERLRVALLGRATDANAITNTSSTGKDVRAYSLNIHSKELLAQLGVWPGVEHATPVRAMAIFDDAGAQVDFMEQAPTQPKELDRNAEDATHPLSWIVDVPILEQSLRQACASDRLITHVSEAVTAKLTVVCEGKHSQSREAFGVDYETLAYPQHAIAARLQSSQPHHGRALQWFQGQDIVALLPLGGAAGNELALVWSAHTSHADALLALNESDFCERLLALTRQVYPNLQLISARMRWPLQHSHAKRWIGVHQGTTFALAGDAAHAIHPLAGLGLNLGLGDAAALAQVLQHRAYWREVNDLKVLREYERERMAQARLIGAACDGLQTLYAHQHLAVKNLRKWGMRAFNQSPLLKRQAMRLASQ